MAGFFVRFFFVGTDAPQIKAAKILPLVDRGYVYDNSAENAEPALQFRTINGRIEKVYGTGHEWAEIARESVARQECENTAGPAEK